MADTPGLVPESKEHTEARQQATLETIQKMFRDAQQQRARTARLLLAALQDAQDAGVPIYKMVKAVDAPNRQYYYRIKEKLARSEQHSEEHFNW